ncbi:hypothetical protein RHSIM_Rhsim08G0089100 [Rhododendron simsii]|uniref:Uncharacterized protein n=1 Tax=Rhododendron simsii TaxID=118357 RepID=A0A834LFF1_RHOSS|nr:hypothetical protein RHSIM_Rhsim08G0089100 [Rhododendron simsii]
MATAIARSVLRTTLRGGGPRAPASKRTFSSSAHHDDAYETAKWEKITYAGIATCTTLAIFILSKGHAHHEEPPAYPYMHIRNKEFPWGPDGLFEAKKHH